MKDKLYNCIEDKDTNYVPIWFMRQAGRYLPEFREIRKNNSDFIKLCLNEKLVSEISLQPIKRFDIDAVILFSDILIIPYGLGQKVFFKKNLFFLTTFCWFSLGIYHQKPWSNVAQLPFYYSRLR